MWTDSHCHVHEGKEPGVQLVRAREAGVGRVVCVGTGVEESRKAVELARLIHRAVAAHSSSAATPPPSLAFATVGLHPHEASHGAAGVAGVLAELGDAEEGGRRLVVGVGECGLDYHYDHSPRAAQREAFAAQVALANERDLPLVVHTREAWEDTFAVIASAGLPRRVVFHCFTGGPAEAAQCLELGAYLSFSGITTFKNADDIRAAAVLCPLDRVLVETDSPFLTPLPHRGRPNEPRYVPLVGAAVAAAKDLDVTAIEAASTANASVVFGIGDPTSDPGGSG